MKINYKILSRSPGHSPASILFLLALFSASAAVAAPAPVGFPDDPYFFTNTEKSFRQDDLSDEGTDVAGAWEYYTTGRRDISCAILDSGVDYAHQDLRNQIALNRAEISAIAAARGVNDLASIDSNGDGVIEFSEFAAPASGILTSADDSNGNGFLDRGDLNQFANGIDEDGNGLVDDFGGWDFDDNDNDEFDHRFFGHGTGRAGIVAAEADNGVGVAGICPHCSLVNLRIGDTFIVSGQKTAQAIIYAAMRGVSAINMSLGVIGDSPFLREAFEYAYRVKNVVPCSAAANEFSYHHNLPSFLDTVLSISAVVRDREQLDWREYIYWVEKVGYSNFGPHTFLASPTEIPGVRMTGGVIGGADYGMEGGTSSAAPGVAGIVSLLASFGRDLFETGGISSPLSAQEIKQLLRAGATDISGTRWNAGIGFDQFTGYGRVDAYESLRLLDEKQIPPVVEIRSPEWFTPIRKTDGLILEVEAFISAARAENYTWVLEYGVGPNPKDEPTIDPLIWKEISSGSATATVEGKIADFDLTSVRTRVVYDTLEDLPGPISHQVTIRLRVIDNLGISAEDRTTFFLFNDDDLKEQAPIKIDASVEASPVLYDIDGDGADEIIIATGAGEIIIYDGEGNEIRRLLTNPVELPFNLPTDFNWSTPRYEIVSSPVVGDIDGDGSPEIAAATVEGLVYLWDAIGGEIQPGFPVQTGTLGDAYNQEAGSRAEVVSTLTLADLLADGKLELIVPAMNGRLYVFDSGGSVLPGFPVVVRDQDPGELNSTDLTSFIVSSPAVGNIDGSNDGSLEIVVASSESYSLSSRLYAYSALGELLPNFPVKTPGLVEEAMNSLPLIGIGTPSSISMADIDRNGDLEIMVAPFASPEPRIYNHDGTVFSRLLFARGEDNVSGELLSAWVNSTGTFGDLDGDRELDVFGGTIGAFSLGGTMLAGEKVNHLVAGWNAKTGKSLPRFPLKVEDWQIFMNYALAELDGDKYPELIVGSGGYYLHAFNYLGEEPEGWPKVTGGWILGAPAVGDVDGDGTVEVVAATREGYLFIYDSEGDPDEIQWGQFQHDASHTGNYGMAPKKKETDSSTGCDCSATGGGLSGLLSLLLLLAPIGVRRIRQKI